ncbi:MAG: acetyl-CoA carboxylase, carboxyltransferase subunit beta, partial [Pseudomonadota bacterium]
MNWLDRFVRSSFKALGERTSKADEPKWVRCPETGEMITQRELQENAWVFPSGHHHQISVGERLKNLYDNGEYEQIPLPDVPRDPLKFRDRKKYTDRLKEARSKSRNNDALQIACGKIKGNNVVVAAFDFDFMAGSMGRAVGEGFVKAASLAVERRTPLLSITASGGARMQEGVFSLMQLPRTVLAVQQLKDAHLPYVVLLCNPTTGGVSASLAMLGDLHIAEPKATIGFAGRRVIEQTVREDLPDNFQTAEHLLDHGMIDAIVDRRDLPSATAGCASWVSCSRTSTGSVSCAWSGRSRSACRSRRSRRSC